MKSKNLNFLEHSGPLQACNGIALPFFTLYIYMCVCVCVCNASSVFSEVTHKFWPLDNGQIWSFITVFKRARYPSHPEPDQSSPRRRHISWRFIVILSCHLRLGLPNCLFTSGFRSKTPFAPLPLTWLHLWRKQTVYPDSNLRIIIASNVYVFWQFLVILFHCDVLCIGCV